MFTKTVFVLAIGAAIAEPAAAQPVDTALIDAGSANDWLTYHGSYKSYHYSPLDQITFPVAPSSAKVRLYEPV